jgi:hypothetical protein
VLLQNVGGHFALVASLAVDQISDFPVKLTQPFLHLINESVKGVGNVPLVSLGLGLHIQNFKILVAFILFDHLGSLLHTNTHLKPSI